METEESPIKAVELMREIRTKINKEIEGMSFEELRHYLDESLAKSEIWQRLKDRETPTSSR
jgi:hypothetical protein